MYVLAIGELTIDLTARKTPESLLTETSRHLKDEAIQIAQTKAQRIMLKRKVALATEEAIRAYTIWHSFKFAKKSIAFERNKHTQKLSRMLMEPILATFNMRFSGDDELIQSKLGREWNVLDKYKSSLLDPLIPGDMILICMVDTIIVLNYAISHQRISGRAKTADDIACSLCSADIDKACTWYTENKQSATHTRIRSLLSGEDWSPKDKSMSGLQMGLIETVELQSDDDVDKATATGGIFKNLWRRRG